MRNRRHGFSYERRRLAKLRDEGCYGFRAFASKGIVDIIYIDKDGIGHMEQLKFSSIGNARISGKELEDLQRFAQRWVGMPVHVSLVLKNAREKEKVIRLNEKKDS